MHSAEAFDAARALNNMATFREPSLQFLYDASLPIASDALSAQRIRYYIKAVGAGDGNCMLGQVPIYVPVDATRLRWSFGFYRDPTFGVDTPPVQVNVNTVTMYLCSEPVRQVHDNVPSVVVSYNEVCKTFAESFLTGAWTSNTIVARVGGV